MKLAVVVLVLLLVAPRAWALNEDSQGEAARLCVEQGLERSSPGFSACVADTARALGSGNPATARQQARAAVDADRVCRSYGIAQDTLNFRQYLANELERAAAR